MHIDLMKKYLTPLQLAEIEWEARALLSASRNMENPGYNDTLAETLPIVIAKDSLLWSLEEIAANPGEPLAIHTNENVQIDVIFTPVTQTSGFNIEIIDIKTAEISLKENYDAVDLLEAARFISRYPFLKIAISEQKSIIDSFNKTPYGLKKYYFEKILLGRKPSGAFRFLDEAGALVELFPEVAAGKGLSQNKFHLYDIYEHTLYACDGVLKPDFILRCAALLHDIGKVPTRKEKPSGEATFYNHEIVSANLAVSILKRFGISKDTGLKIKFLIRNHMFHYTNEWTDRAIRRFLRKVTTEDLQNLIELRKADRIGSGKKNPFPKGLEKLIAHIEDVIERDSQMKVTQLAIGGRELMEMGLSEGPKIGIILKQILEEVKAEQYENTEDVLLERARELLAEVNAPGLTYGKSLDR